VGKTSTTLSLAEAAPVIMIAINVTLGPGYTGSVGANFQKQMKKNINALTREVKASLSTSA
jgi:hypothetical protein